jgi:hypothetical protein
VGEETSEVRKTIKIAEKIENTDLSFEDTVEGEEANVAEVEAEEVKLA